MAGDDPAFRALYRAHTPVLYRLALRIAGGSDAEAEEIVQEAWARAVRALGGFEGRASLRTWLSRIVTNVAMERLRRARGERETPTELDRLPSPCVPGVERIDLARAFTALPAGYRAVLVLHDVEGYTHEEIAALLGVSPGTSKSQLSRGRAWVRRALGHEYTVE